MEDTHRLTEKVARSWLDSLRGPKPSQDRSVGDASFRSREDAKRQLDAVYMDLKKHLNASIKKSIPDIRRKQKDLARRYRVDPVYLDWALMSSHYPQSIPRRSLQGLHTIRAILTWFGDVPNNWSNRKDPQDRDEVRAVDSAIKDLGKWFESVEAKKITQDHVQEVIKKARALRRTLGDEFFGDEKNAPLLLLQEFKRRLFEDRYPTRAAVQAVMNMMG